MRVLLDTHILLWAIIEPSKLPGAAAVVLKDRSNEVFYSVASLWEMVLKEHSGRPMTTAPIAHFAKAAISSGYDEISIDQVHVARVQGLPLHHRDPFDRLLLAQALEEPARLLTADRRLAAYSELVMVV